MPIWKILAVPAAVFALAVPALAAAQDFASADIDRDGVISINELQAAMPETAAATLALFMRAKDANRDGFVTLAEIADDTPIRPNFGMPLLWAFEEADLNHNGRVTLDELQAEGTPEAQPIFDAYLKAIDKDGDGLSKAEWDSSRPTVVRRPAS